MTAYLVHFNDSKFLGYPNWQLGAVGKCHHDREIFAQEIGIKLIDAFDYHWPDEPDEVLSARLDGIFAGLKMNDFVFVHWPFSTGYSRHWCQAFIDRIHAFDAKLIFLADDIASWRDLPPLPATMSREQQASYHDSHQFAQEIYLLKQADGLVLHSLAMKKRLQAQAALAGEQLTNNITIYGPSGYVCDYFRPRRHFGQGIDYAGAFFKAKFLSQLPTSFKINAYGDDLAELNLAEHPNVTLYPRMDPAAIVQELQGSFGLVWDSDSYPTVTGLLGDYERYNTPAKFPMYLAADEPVIIWSQSPLANFVLKNGLGLTIDTLDQLPAKVAAITDSQYQQLLDNVQRISGLIRSGYYLKKAYLDVMGLISDANYQAQ